MLRWFRENMRRLYAGMDTILVRMQGHEEILLRLEETMEKLMSEFDDLKSAVAATTDQNKSAVLALGALAAKIAGMLDGAKDLAEAKAMAADLAAQLNDSKDALAKAILTTDGDPSNDPHEPSQNG